MLFDKVILFVVTTNCKIMVVLRLYLCMVCVMRLAIPNLTNVSSAYLQLGNHSVVKTTNLFLHHVMVLLKAALKTCQQDWVLS